MEIFSFVSVKGLLKKIGKCDVQCDETDGSLENHKYLAKFSTHFRNRPQKLRLWQLRVCALVQQAAWSESCIRDS